MDIDTTALKQIAILIVGCGVLLGGMAWYFHSGSMSQQLNGDMSATSSFENGPVNPEAMQKQNDIDTTIHNPMNAHAIITTNYGEIDLELYDDLMPITTKNFEQLAESGFYDDTKFHRVIKGFMIQGGDPLTKEDDESVYGTGGPTSTIPDEFVSDPLLSNTRGTIAMANTGQPNSGGSQFFINTVDNTNLDFDKPPSTSKHPVFGHVIKGMDVVDKISDVQTKARDLPVYPVVVQSIKIIHSQG